MKWFILEFSQPKLGVWRKCPGYVGVFGIFKRKIIPARLLEADNVA